MAVYGLTGTLSFGNRTARDRARTTITSEAVLRGLVGSPIPNIPLLGGWTDIGTTDCSISYVHWDEQVISRANVDLAAWLDQNGRGGGGGPDVFGTMLVNEFADFTDWMARRTLDPVTGLIV